MTYRAQKVYASFREDHWPGFEMEKHRAGKGRTSSVADQMVMVTYGWLVGSALTRKRRSWAALCDTRVMKFALHMRRQMKADLFGLPLTLAE